MLLSGIQTKTKDLLADYYQYTGDRLGCLVLPRPGEGRPWSVHDQESPGYEEGSAMAKWADANPALALREYNKRQPNSYSGTGPSDEEIEQGGNHWTTWIQFGSLRAIRRIPLGETCLARESNIEQTAAAQPVAQQRQLNLDEIQRYMDSGVPGLNGKQMLGEAIKKKIALTPTQLRNDPFALITMAKRSYPSNDFYKHRDGPKRQARMNEWYENKGHAEAKNFFSAENVVPNNPTNYQSFTPVASQFAPEGQPVVTLSFAVILTATLNR